MWAIFRSAGGFISLALVCVSTQAMADSNYIQNNQQFGVNLPQATLPSGSDEIRTTDGATCRSAVGGDGAYMDVGVIGSPDSQDANASAAAYGRIVVPLGYKAKRLDCTKLYDLEIRRLKMELELARMGSAGSTNTPAAPMNSNWAEEGWGTQPPAAPQKIKQAQPEPVAVVFPEEKITPPAKPKKNRKAKPVVQPPEEIVELY
jgi:hypothetical protein